ncbi:MAG TPA: glycosyltransferase [Gemmatimonadaceae bacterium]|nr:glycosyltransferase [Gemmatimonadaceae bacterium]
MNGIRVLVVIYTNPSAYPPVERMSAFLHARGAKVRLLGASGLETDGITSARLDALDLRLTSRKGSGVRAQLRYLRFLLWACAHVVIFRPRWVHVSDPLAAPVGLFATLLRRRLIYQEHDAPVAPPRSISARLLGRARAVLLRRAEVVVAPNEERSAALAREAGRRVETVWNCPARDEIRERAPGTSGRFRLLYQGSLVPERVPPTIIDALVRDGLDVDLELIGYETIGSRGYVAQLRQLASERGMRGSVVHHEAIDHEAKLALTTSADLGWAVVPARDGNFNDRTMVGASNKIFEYLACGVPALVSTDRAWSETFARPGFAIPVDPLDAAAVAAALAWAIEHRGELREMGARGRERILSEWNFESAFAPIAARILGTDGAR